MNRLQSTGITSRQVNKLMMVLLLLMAMFNLYQLTLRTAVYEISSLAISPVYGDDNYGASIDDMEDEADRIILRAYEKSYAHILPCSVEKGARACMAITNDYFHQPRTKETGVPTVPWWFQTLIRDVMENGAFGFWHHHSTIKPPLHFCAIEKVATQQWRRVFCELNADECKENPDACPNPTDKCRWKTKRPMPINATKAVFLRDPLERLLSGFLNKCYKVDRRRVERHCEPNVVFDPGDNLLDKSGKKFPNLVLDLEGTDKEFFAAFVDVLPLQWNVHFVPQAIICDLRRTIDSYDFVGEMGTDFMLELERMANQFGGPLPEILDEQFGYVDHVKNHKVNLGNDGNWHSTHAPALVQKFYTASTVRRALELMSIDYVTLGLEIPEWARQMLRDDVS